MIASKRAGARGAAAVSAGAVLPSERQVAAAALVALVAIATGLRLIPIVVQPCLNWADEVFQAIEPAHRLVYGYGLVAWEFQLGMRSWLLPGAVAAIIELARAVGDGPQYYLTAIALAFGVLAAAPVVCCFLWARRAFGLAGGIVAGLVVAIAPELVYYGGRTLNEVVAAHVLVIGFYLLEPGYPVDSRRRIFAAGALLGLVCLLRNQLAPAAAVIALWSAAGAGRLRLKPLVLGGLAALAFGGGLDWLTLGYPFASVWRNVLYNLFYGVSSEISVDPGFYYVLGELGVWQGAAPFLALAVFLGARRLPALFVAAIVVVLVHSAIAHKEYRFIYAAILMAMMLASIGMAQLAYWATQWLSRQGVAQIMAAAACVGVLSAGWGALAYNVWSGETLTVLRQRDADELRAITFVRDLPAPCGIGLYGDEAWVRYGGYSYLHRAVPLFWPKDEPALAATAAAFDTVLYKNAPPPRFGFTPSRCFGEVCVARRAGGCDARPEPQIWFPERLRALAPAVRDFPAIPAGLRQSR